MFQLFSFGLLLGWGAAIPIGAINLEIIRRNLKYGTPQGLALGFGAGGADVTYLVLLSYGALQILNSPNVLKIVGILGSFILIYFGANSLKQKSATENQAKANETKQSIFRHLSDGYLLTLINPFNIIFWASVSVTIAEHTGTTYGVLYSGLGVLCGTLSWMCSLNLFLHLTRHKISHQVINKINIIGGLILITFGLFGFYRAFSLF